MDFKNIPKGFFNLKKDISKGKESEIDSNNPQNGKAIVENEKSIQDFGFESASAQKGSKFGLSICLYRIYNDHKDRIKKDVAKQEELKKPYRLKLLEIKTENEGIVKRQDKIKSEEIQGANNKIEKLKKDISEIRANPERLTGDKSGKASYYVGLIILLFLTVYLFIFYSSASYSAFFKEFSMSEIGLANSIFDAQALSKAYYDGFTELVLIITIPAVFLGLGYLIHKSQEKKGTKKFLFIGSLIFVTFLFDLIIAYEICEKIYNIHKTNSFQNIPDYSLSFAFQSINFWLIIFAGFVVYLIWGLVFDFTIEAYEKLDKVRVAIKNKEEEIKNIEENTDKLNAALNALEEKENKNNGEINKLNDLINHSTIIPKEFEQYLYQFMQGWLHWMSGNLHSELSKEECQAILTSFIQTNITQQIEFTNN